MISIIISTHKSEYFDALKENISNTIGVPCEIIGIENHARYSICEAYNIGINKANYPYLCFVHEDVIFNTENWGGHLINLMQQDNKIGLIGIAGSKFKSTYPSTGWGTGPFVTNFWRGHYKTLNKNKEIISVDLDKNKVKKEIEEMLIVDGVFIFTKKEVFDKCKFDDKMLTHFHGYDTDFSLQVFFNSYKIIIDRNIDILHYSKGVQGKEFATANRAISKKWSQKLPVATPDLKLGRNKLLYYNILVWMGYLWYFLQRKLKLK